MFANFASGIPPQEQRQPLALVSTSSTSFAFLGTKISVTRSAVSAFVLDSIMKHSSPRSTNTHVDRKFPIAVVAIQCDGRFLGALAVNLLSWFGLYLKGWLDTAEIVYLVMSEQIGAVRNQSAKLGRCVGVCV